MHAVVVQHEARLYTPEEPLDLETEDCYESDFEDYLTFLVLELKIDDDDLTVFSELSVYSEFDDVTDELFSYPVSVRTEQRGTTYQPQVDPVCCRILMLDDQSVQDSPCWFHLLYQGNSFALEDDEIIEFCKSIDVEILLTL